MSVGTDLGFRPRDRAAYLPAADALVLADVHLGRGATSNVEVPFHEGEAIADRLTALVDHFTPAEVVFAGDLLHAFSTIPAGVADALETLIACVEARGAKPVVVEGNHDPMLEGLADPVPVYRLDDGTVVCHGHEPPSELAERYVIGHEHPAITIEGLRRPCYLLGTGVFRAADVLVLPAFNRLTVGTVINGLTSGDAHSPFLADIESFRPVVWDAGEDDPLAFPALGSVRDYL